MFFAFHYSPPIYSQLASSLILLIVMSFFFLLDNVWYRSCMLGRQLDGVKKRMAYITCFKSQYIAQPSFASSGLASTSFDFWHYRLGHIPTSKQYILHSSCPSIYVFSQTYCEICHFAKQQRSFTLKIIHSDIWGPSPVTIKGFKILPCYCRLFKSLYMSHEKSSWYPYVFTKFIYSCSYSIQYSNQSLKIR